MNAVEQEHGAMQSFDSTEPATSELVTRSPHPNNKVMPAKDKRIDLTSQPQRLAVINEL